MNIKEYVDEVLCVPITRIGNKYIVEAIELVLDTREHKFYTKLAEIHKATPRYLEKAMRDAKELGLSYMDESNRLAIFGIEIPTVNEYVIKAAEHYRRTYEDKEEG